MGDFPKKTKEETAVEAQVKSVNTQLVDHFCLDWSGGLIAFPVHCVDNDFDPIQSYLTFIKTVFVEFIGFKRSAITL